MIAQCKMNPCPSPEISCKIIGGSPELRATEMGKAVLEHMGTHHMQFMQETVIPAARQFNAFLVMNQVQVDDDVITQRKEEARTFLSERLMEFSEESLFEEEGDDMIDDETIEVVCPECGHEFEVDVAEEDDDELEDEVEEEGEGEDGTVVDVVDEDDNDRVI